MNSLEEAMDTSETSDSLSALLAEFEIRDEATKQKIKIQEVTFDRFRKQ